MKNTLCVIGLLLGLNSVAFCANANVVETPPGTFVSAVRSVFTASKDNVDCHLLLANSHKIIQIPLQSGDFFYIVGAVGKTRNDVSRDLIFKIRYSLVLLNQRLSFSPEFLNGFFQDQAQLLRVGKCLYSGFVALVVQNGCTDFKDQLLEMAGQLGATRTTGA